MSANVPLPRCNSPAPLNTSRRDSTLEQATAPGSPGTFLNTSLTSSVEYVFPSVRYRPEDAANPCHCCVGIPSGVALQPPRYMARSSKLTPRITNPRTLAQNIGSEQQCRAIDRSIRRRNDGERACRRLVKMTYVRQTAFRPHVFLRIGVTFKESRANR